MKIAIVGSRDYVDLERVTAYVNSLPDDTELVSGGARGVDRTAEQAAWSRKLTVKCFPADWEQYGKEAGFIRNQDIVNYADLVVAFWDGKSRGTAHTMRLAASQNKLFHVFGVYEGESMVEHKPNCLHRWCRLFESKRMCCECGAVAPGTEDR